MKAWGELAQALGAKSGDGAAVEGEPLFQALAITLQRENARAVLRRAGLATESAPGFLDPWASVHQAIGEGRVLRGPFLELACV